MKRKTKVFKPGDIVYLKSLHLGCSCVVRITSAPSGYAVESLFYNCGVSHGKDYDHGCTGVSADSNCIRDGWKASRPCYKFLKLFLEGPTGE